MPTPLSHTLFTTEEHNLPTVPIVGRGPRLPPFTHFRRTLPRAHPTPLCTGDGSSFKLDLSSQGERSLGESYSFTGGIPSSRTGSSLPPPPPVELPAGWDSAIDEVTGGRYYFNLSSGERTWEPPAAFWEEAVDPRSGRSYFYNHKTKERTWARPKEMPRPQGERIPAMAASASSRFTTEESESSIGAKSVKSTGALAAAQLAVAGASAAAAVGSTRRLSSS